MQTPFDKMVEQLKNNDPKLEWLSLHSYTTDSSNFQVFVESLKESTHLTAITLINKKIGSRAAEQLFASLKPHSKLKQLDLEHNDIADEGVQYLAELLLPNDSLTDLNLRRNLITPQGMTHLAQALKALVQLKTLKLSQNRINSDGVRNLGAGLAENKSLTCLDLSGNEIKNLGLSYITQALIENKTLTSLDLGFNEIDNAGVVHLVELVNNSHTLTCLDLSGNNILATGINRLSTALQTSTSLTQLRFVDSNLGNAEMKELGNLLQKNTSIATLEIRSNAITDLQDLADALVTNTSLTNLDLGFNKFGCAGAQYLAESLKMNAHLIHLDLSSTEIEDTGLFLLSEALKENRTLRTLDLWNCKITTQGVMKLAEALAVNTTLKKLALGHNNIDEIGIRYLAAALKQNYLGLTESMEIKDNELSSCLKRNSQWASHQKLLNELFKQDCILGTVYSITRCLTGVKKFIVEHQDFLSEHHYTVEAFRLLIALQQRISVKSNSEFHALRILLSAFTHPPLQLQADRMLGLLLSGDLGLWFAENNQEREVQLLRLYAFRNHVHAPEIKIFALISLFKLLHPGKTFTVQEKLDFEAQNILMPQQEFLNLVNIAFMQLDEPSEVDKQYLLQRMLTTAIYDPSMLATACSFPTFVKLLRTRFPHARNFSTVEHCLLAAYNASPLVIPIVQNQEITVAPQQFQTLDEIGAQLKNNCKKIVAEYLSTLKEEEIDELVTYEVLFQRKVSNNLPTTMKSPEDKIPSEEHTSAGEENAMPQNLSQEDTESTTRIEAVCEEESDLVTAMPDEHQLLDLFLRAYNKKLREDKRGCFGFFRASRLRIDASGLRLHDIFNHALHNKGYRTRNVLIEQGWLDRHGNIIDPQINAFILAQTSQVNVAKNDMM
ncbi:MAG: hypothetical protein J0I93_08555 [Legionella sp.]|nr:hypothetical protein [Legionella sp.]